MTVVQIWSDLLFTHMWGKEKTDWSHLKAGKKSDLCHCGLQCERSLCRWKGLKWPQYGGVVMRISILVWKTRSGGQSQTQLSQQSSTLIPIQSWAKSPFRAFHCSSCTFHRWQQKWPLTDVVCECVCVTYNERPEATIMRPTQSHCQTHTHIHTHTATVGGNV